MCGCPILRAFPIRVIAPGVLTKVASHHVGLAQCIWGAATAVLDASDAICKASC